MLRRIKLYGQLAKFVGHKILHAEVSSAAEAVRFLVANFPELEKHMADQHYRVSVGTHDLSLEELHDPAAQHEITFVPVIAGAGAVGRILAGVAMVASAFFTGGATIGLFGLAAPIAVSSVLGYVGASLILGGVAQLLSPVPQIPEANNDPRNTFNFSGVQQTSRQGTPVPVCYGKALVGSVVISAGVDTVQVKA